LNDRQGLQVTASGGLIAQEHRSGFRLAKTARQWIGPRVREAQTVLIEPIELIVRFAPNRKNDPVA